MIHNAIGPYFLIAKYAQLCTCSKSLLSSIAAIVLLHCYPLNSELLELLEVEIKRSTESTQDSLKVTYSYGHMRFWFS